jgi:hypothetical protein
MMSADPRKTILDVLMKHPEGLTIVSLAKSSSLHRHTATKYVHELLGAGIVFQRSVGIAKLCYLSRNIENQNVEKRLLDGLEERRNGTGSPLRLLAIVAVVAFLMSGTVIFAYESAGTLNETDSSNSSSIDAGFLADMNSSNVSSTPVYEANISTDENGVLSEINSSTEKGQTSDDLTVENSTNISEAISEGLKDVNLTINASETSDETQETTPKKLELSLQYPQNVTRGETFEVKATVLNTGSSAADNVALDWSIPNGFTLSEGSQREFCGIIESNVSCVSIIKLKTDMSTDIGTSKLKAVVSYE